MEQSKSTNTALIVGISLVLCCICTIVLALGAYVYYVFNQTDISSFFSPEFPSQTHTSTPEAVVTRPPADSISTDTLDALENTIVPACELGLPARRKM